MKKRVLVIVAAIVCAVGLIATVLTMADEPVELSGGDYITNEQAKEPYQRLMEQALNYARNEDYNGFASLFRNADADAINSYYQLLKNDILGDGYPDFDYTVFAGNGVYFAGYTQNNLTSGYYPDVRTMQHNITRVFSYVDGEWKFDNSSAATESVDNEFLANYIPEGLVSAVQAGRNAINFSNGADFSWVNEDIVIPGAVDSKVYLAWQNEDGSVDLLVNLKNGTNEIRNIYSMEITLTDETLGTILDQTISYGNLAPGKAVNIPVHISADNVYTGTQAWGVVNNHVHFQTH